MIRQIERIPFEEAVQKDLQQEGECWLETGQEYSLCPEAVLRGEILYLGLVAEKSPAGSRMTRALWFGETVPVILKSGSRIWRILLHADRCHISGGIFTELLGDVRAKGLAEDLAVVWETSFVSAELLDHMPEGNYRNDSIGLFEMHYDNPRFRKENSKMEKVMGCRFSLAPMSDSFIDIILSSIGKVDTTRVWSVTDELSTIYRGRRIHVLDAWKACFVYSYRKGIHMTMNATISQGCPGDAEMDEARQDAVWSEEEDAANEAGTKDLHFPAVMKFALYPMGRNDYLDVIGVVIQHARDLGLLERTQFYATVLKGDVQDLFAYLDWACAYCEEQTEHYALEVSFAVNLPEEE